MIETKLNSNDKLQLKEDLKTSMVLGLFFSIALVFIVGLIPGIMYILDKQFSDGFVMRGLYIIGLLFISFLAISWTNILKYIDLRKDKKLIFTMADYEVIIKKDAAFILTRDAKKQKIGIDHELISYIDKSKPLTIEITIFSKSLLFISHDKANLLDELYNDDKHSCLVKCQFLEH